jgi:hypothetical protein
MDLSSRDPLKPDVRELVNRVVTKHVVDLNTWFVIAELVKLREFDAGQPFTAAFRTPDGTEHHRTGLICGLQSEFLFHKPFVFFNNAELATVHPAIASIAEERLRCESLAWLSFVVGKPFDVHSFGASIGKAAPVAEGRDAAATTDTTAPGG